MTITLEEALAFECLRNTQVVAGKGGLKRFIRYINVMEVPDIVDWVSGDELLLTTGYPFKDSTYEFVDLITRLSQKNLAGLAIKPNRFLSHIPEEAVAMANKLNFPLLSLPADAHFDQIISALMTEIVNRDYNIIKRTEEMHQAFTRLVLSGGEFQEIAQSLADVCLAYITITSEFDELLATAKPSVMVSEIEGGLDKKMAGDEALLERPVYLQSRIIATIRMSTINRMVEDGDVMAIERAATIVALVFLKKHAAGEVEKKFRDDFLTDLVSGEIETRKIVVERSRFFGIDISLKYLVYFIDVDSFEDVFLKTLEQDEKKSHALMLRLYNFVNKAFRARSDRSIIWSRSDSIIALSPTDNEIYEDSDKVKSLSKKIAHEIKAEINKHIKEFTVSIGIGTLYLDIMDIHLCYKEAVTATRVGKAIWGKDGVYHYDDLGVYRLLYQFPNRTELSAYADSIIGNLKQYDINRGAVLVKTLEQYLISNKNQKAAAEKMFIHPKTLSYRLRKVEDILELSLDSTEDCLSLYMALKIDSLMQ